MSVSHVRRVIAEVIRADRWAGPDCHTLVGIQPGAVTAAQFAAPALRPMVGRGEAEQTIGGIDIAVGTVDHRGAMGAQDLLDILGGHAVGMGPDQGVRDPTAITPQLPGLVVSQSP